MSLHWLVLFGAIAISMAGQTLLKAGAGAPDFVTQLFDLRTLGGFVLYGGSAVLYIVASAPHPDVGGDALHGDFLCRGALLIGHYAFDEALSLGRLGAVGLICSGVVLLALA